jgi:hypothetical protein
MSDLFKDWVSVIPASGELKETARELLTLAGDPSLVRTDGNGTEFLVPAWVADAYTTPSPAPRKRAARPKPSEE